MVKLDFKKTTNFFKKRTESTKYHLTLIALFSVTLYLNTLNNALFWDDDDFILNNKYIKSWKYISYYFSQNVISGAGLVSDYWRPILMLVFSFQWSIWGAWAPGYHLTNLVFHTICSLLVYILIHRLFKNKWLSLATATIFVIHPLQTEAVAYANSLGDSLSVFFLLLSLINYDKFLLKNPSDKYFLLKSLVLYSLAIMSKETAIIGAPISLIIYLLREKNLKISITSIRKLAKNILGHFSILIAYILLRATVLNFRNTFNLYNEQNEFTSNLFVRVMTFFKIFYNYISLIFFPKNLHMERSLQIPKSFFDPALLTGIVLFVLMFFTIIYSFKKNKKVIWFGGAWFLIGLIPISNVIVPINGLIYEHWMYFPLIGFSLFLIGICKEIRNKYYPNKHIDTIALFIVLIYFSYFSYKTYIRNNEWENPIKFYESTLQYSPNNYKLLNNLGKEYSEITNYEQAKSYYTQAIKLDGLNPVAFHNLANAHMETGDFGTAEKYYLKALELNSNFLFSKSALIKMYFENKDWDKIEILTLDHKAKYVEDYLLLFNLAQQLNKYSMANEYISKALELDPSNSNLKNLQIKNQNLISP